jgi:phosphatidylglycerophosphate synthase
VHASADSRRAGPELVLQFVFRPLSNLVVPPLARLGVDPVLVVLANAAAGLVAAIALARGELVAAAVLIQLKTLLDNCDGQLARASGRVTLLGRYLDTEADLLVVAALFAALGHVTGQLLLAVLAFAALVLVLAVDFNATELFREAHGTARPLAPATGGAFETLLAKIYELVLGPLDRATRRLWEGVDVDRFTVTALANMGLSTQLAVLGICLVLDLPEAYLWIALCGLLAVLGLRLRAEVRARRLRAA